MSHSYSTALNALTASFLGDIDAMIRRIALETVQTALLGENTSETSAPKRSRKRKPSRKPATAAPMASKATDAPENFPKDEKTANVLRLLKSNSGNVSAVARALQMSRRTVARIRDEN